MAIMKDKTAVLYLSQQGRVVAEKIVQKIDSAAVINVQGDFMKRVAEAWNASDALICVMAAGIVVRAIGPLLKDKYRDPCVVVVDESSRFSISLLSGHVGGGNSLAEDVANCLGNTPVVTTASDNLGLTALDLWLKNNRLLTGQRDLLIKKSAKLNRERRLTCHIDMHYSGKLPEDIVECRNADDADIIITSNLEKVAGLTGSLVAFPQTLCLGMGCNRNTPVEEINGCFLELMRKNQLEREWFQGVASIDLKINEKGLIAFARQHSLPLSFYSKDRLNMIEGVEHSEAAMKATGAKGVAEPASVLMASDRLNGGELLIVKQKWPNVTMAVSREILRLK